MHDTNWRATASADSTEFNRSLSAGAAQPSVCMQHTLHPMPIQARAPAAACAAPPRPPWARTTAPPPPAPPRAPCPRPRPLLRYYPFPLLGCHFLPLLLQPLRWPPPSSAPSDADCGIAACVLALLPAPSALLRPGGTSLGTSQLRSTCSQCAWTCRRLAFLDRTSYRVVACMSSSCSLHVIQCIQSCLLRLSRPHACMSPCTVARGVQFSELYPRTLCSCSPSRAGCARCRRRRAACGASACRRRAARPAQTSPRRPCAPGGAPPAPCRACPAPGGGQPAAGNARNSVAFVTGRPCPSASRCAWGGRA